MIYLNNAATSFPKPLAVVQSVERELLSIPCEYGRGSCANSNGDQRERLRKKMAAFLGVTNARQLSFCSGATEALNTAILGVAEPGDHFISSALEHNSVLRPLRTLEKSGRIRLSIINCDSNGNLDFDALNSALNIKTKAIVVSACSNVLGNTLDIERLSKEAHKYAALLIVDAAQAVGAIPIDVEKLGLDILCFAAHKYLLGLSGLGGMYIREGLQVKALKSGGTGIKSQYPYQPEEYPLHFEAGTANTTGLVALEAALDFINSEGLEKLSSKRIKLLNYMRTELEQISNIKIYAQDQSKPSSTILAFNIDNFEAEEVGYILQSSFDIIVRAGLHCAPLIHKPLGCEPHGCVRVSPSCFTSEDEVAAFVAAIKEISRSPSKL